MPSRKREESFGQELVIEQVQFEDAGKYECQGINEETSVPLRRSFDLSIEGKSVKSYQVVLKGLILFFNIKAIRKVLFLGILDKRSSKGLIFKCY